MNPLISIDDLNTTNGQVIIKKKSPALSVLLTILGIATLVVAYSPSLAEQMNLITGLWVLGLGLIVAGLIGIFAPGKALYYKPTGERLKQQELYFNMKDKLRVMDALMTGNMDQLPQQVENTKSAMLVILYTNRDKSCILAQPMEYVPFQFVPSQQLVFLER